MARSDCGDLSSITTLRGVADWGICQASKMRDSITTLRGAADWGSCQASKMRESFPNDGVDRGQVWNAVHCALKPLGGASCIANHNFVPRLFHATDACEERKVRGSLLIENEPMIGPEKVIEANLIEKARREQCIHQQQPR